MKFPNVLQSMIESQRDYQHAIKSEVLTSVTQDECEDATKNTILYMMRECHEILDEINYKVHRPRHKVNKENILEESIDVLMFLINIWIIWGFSAVDVMTMFIKKTKKNYKRIGK